MLAAHRDSIANRIEDGDHPALRAVHARERRENELELVRERRHGYQGGGQLVEVVHVGELATRQRAVVTAHHDHQRRDQRR